MIVFSLLFGCVGTSFQEGEGKYINAEFPDIRTAPSRDELRNFSNKKAVEDIVDLEEEREKMKIRDEVLRERAFSF